MKTLRPGDSQESRSAGEGNHVYLKVKGKGGSQNPKGLQESIWLIEN